MEEQSQKECKTKKCCAKGVIIVIVCSLLCFFIGYYAGSKSLAKVSSSAINRPFNPSRIPKIPTPAQMRAIKSLPKTNNLPNMQRPPIPKNPRVQPPNTQRPPVTNTQGVNVADSAKGKSQVNNNTEQKK
ncbi:MAG: hypothetical protein J6T23_07970 [Elusimicrobia bacterium]|nr:hypothetical protein [Elusimicrobiota bacterium]